GPTWWFSTGENQPPSKPIILSAPSFGKSETQLNFSAITTDPEGNDVYYMWDWGDGSYSNWLGPFGSGQTIKTNHKWDETGKFEIKVKAKDASHAESYWSKPVQLILENEPPFVEFVKPIPGAVYFANKLLLPFFITLIIGPLDITVNASDNISGMNKVEFYIKDMPKNTDPSAPYVWTWNEVVFRLTRFEIKVIVYDNAGNWDSENISLIKFF
ncbi:MAG: Ig-like domain-containing protein, partial [Petrotogales bacterium]